MKLNVENTLHIVNIRHKYKLKYVSISFHEEVVGSGIIIHKSIDNDNPYIIILTVFHIVVPQLESSLLGFVV
jgi:hypothetical protein